MAEINPNTMTKIGSTATVGNGGAASIAFTSIPGTYTDLKILFTARNSRSLSVGQDFTVRFNGTTTSVTARMLQGEGGGSAASYSTADSQGVSTSDNAGVKIFGNYEIYIPNYTSTNYKAFSVDSVSENNATSAFNQLTAGLWSSTAAITSVTIIPSSPNSWMEFSSGTLYGIKATTASVALATGGDAITYNGGYVYHTFLNSGTFTPSKSLTADCLVIAGGGSGGTDNTGNAGGGGAGGLTYFSSITTGASAYTVTVGAGGTAPASGDNIGIQGSNSSFSGTGITTITSTGGGGGAPYSPSTGGSGGSGGGAGQSSAGTGGSPTLNQGFAGGDTTGFRCGAGGGGAGGVGSTGTVSVPGNGGVGSSAFSSWGYATSTGVASSGTYYYAGGGGGASHSSIGGGTPGTGGAGGGGNGARTSSNVPTAGTANTGSGGGGGGDGSGAHTGGNGGKGIIIIRYQVQ